jgi:ADP-heptose:LPS heptosyltransferase
MSTERPIDPTAVRRVLLVRPRFLGDVCLTLPALDQVRALCPTARVAYLTERESAPLLEGDPRIDELITVSREAGAGDSLALIRRLRAFTPDVAIDFFCNPRTAVWVRASGARVRVGYPNKGWRSALYTHHARPRALSAVAFHLASLQALGWSLPATPSPRPRLHLGDAARDAADAALRQLAIPADAPILGLHPGARWMTRRWAPERFTELGRRFLDREPGGFVVISGGPGEEALVREIATELPGDRTREAVAWPIARFVAYQARCAAFVCGDTGPLHTAVAAGAPTLALMSRNRPAMFFPYADDPTLRAYYARVECSPCHRDVCDDLRCLHRLTVNSAWEHLEALIGAVPAPDERMRHYADRRSRFDGT